jgi:hypothetical protein
MTWKDTKIQQKKNQTQYLLLEKLHQEDKLIFKTKNCC